MRGRPEPNEFPPYYSKYIEQIQGDDVVGLLESQLDEALAVLQGIDEEKSLHRYAPDKWSIRQVINHLSDVERLFQFRAFWFARGFDSPLPSFDEKTGAETARADEVSWARHVDEFRTVRQATLTFFRNLPADGWMRSGIASDNHFTVRAIAYILAGHVTHHVTILKERYL